MDTIDKVMRRIGLASAKPPTLRTVGDTARDRKDWPAAAEAYRAHLDTTPDDVAIWIQLGHMLKESGALKPAAAAYFEAYRLTPDDPDLLLNIGHLAKRRGLLRAAARAYRMSYELDGNQAAAEELQLPIFRPFHPLIERRYAGIFRPRAMEAMGQRVATVGNIDEVSHWHVRGWAVDRSNPGLPAEIAFYADGTLVGTATTDMFRADIDRLGYGSPLAGFETGLAIDFSHDDEVEVTARLAATGEELSGSPFKTSAPPLYRQWLQRGKRLKGDERQRLKEIYNAETEGLRLSIVVPVYNTRADWLETCVQSVIDQLCDRWQLVLVDDKSPEPRVREQLRELAARDDRITLVLLDANRGIAGATNAGIAAATGDYVGFLDHDDYLEPEAVHRVLDAARTGADFICSDEAVTGENINVILGIMARPAFSHDYYMSHPYFVHFNVVRTALARAIGGWDETMKISGDVDFVYRAVEQSALVAHIPAVIYRWRTHSTSTGHVTARDDVTAATSKALAAHVAKMGYTADVGPGLRFNCFHVDHRDDRAPTLIVIPTKNHHGLVKACLESLERTIAPNDDVDIVVIDHDSDDPASREYFATLGGRVSVMPYSGPFNFARMNNVAVRAMPDRYKYVLFLNNDVEAIKPGWLEHMRGLAGRSDVGVVGATLIYGNRTVQCSGVVMGLGDLVDHAFRFVPLDEPDGQRRHGYNCSLISIRDYLAVTGACMMVRRDLFLGVGGFDEELAVGYNDTDLCMRLGSLGYKVLSDGYTVLYHHESVTREKSGHLDHPLDYKRFKQRWGHILVDGDPFYNPALMPRGAMDHQPYRLRGDYVAPRLRRVRSECRPAEEALPDVIDARRNGTNP